MSRRPPFARAGGGRVDVRLPGTVCEFLGVAADRLRRVGEDPRSAAFSRLFGQVDEGAARDDPAVVLTRQMMIDEIAGTVAATCHSSEISDDEAECWLKVLGMTIAVRVAELDVRTDEAREALGADDRAFFAALQHLQLSLIEALDIPAKE